MLTHAEPDKGPWHLLQEKRKILGGHGRIGQLKDGLPAEEILCHAQDAGSRSFVVDGNGIGEGVVQIRFAAHPLRDAAGYGFHTPWDPLAEVRVEGSDRSPETRLLRDDVEGRSGPDLPHRQDRRLDRVYLPRDDGL